MTAEPRSLCKDRAIAALCPSCGDLGIVRHAGGKCWMCGGWVGFAYPIKAALRVVGAMKPGSLS